MQPNDRGSALELVDVADERVLAALERVDSMSDEQLRALVKDEDPTVIQAAEAMIDRRHAGRREAI
jgi:hypothetical protein